MMFSCICQVLKIALVTPNILAPARTQQQQITQMFVPTWWKSLSLARRVCKRPNTHHNSWH